MLDKNVLSNRHFEIRAAQDAKFTLEGRALSYKQISANELAPGFREMLMPGCFRDSLAKRELVCLLNHDDHALPLGRQSNGTLDIDDDEDGLDFRCQLDPSNSQHRDVYASVKRGDINGCSFGFNCDDDDFVDGEYEGAACKVRRVKSGRILELSAVTLPFYSGRATSVSARNKAGADWAAEQLRKVTNMIADQDRRSRVHAINMEILKGK
jgi:HK97 family phage prohead protease